MNDLRVILPLPRYEGPNGRSHYRLKNQQAKADKLLALSEGRVDPGTQPMTCVAVIIDWYCATNRMLDVDNALGRCKYFIDGLTHAGWWIDDRVIRQTTIRRWLPGEAAGFKGRVIITARATDPDSLRLVEIEPAHG